MLKENGNATHRRRSIAKSADCQQIYHRKLCLKAKNNRQQRHIWPTTPSCSKSEQHKTISQKKTVFFLLPLKKQMSGVKEALLAKNDK